mmetsp:Transcript_2686/g.7385  ORF Transcript_2686/g.7385 Transcript_2686/m.7385 type:complete len:244 (-) Transcript_2686:625-1356(-)
MSSTRYFSIFLCSMSTIYSGARHLPSTVSWKRSTGSSSASCSIFFADFPRLKSNLNKNMPTCMTMDRPRETTTCWVMNKLRSMSICIPPNLVFSSYFSLSASLVSRSFARWSSSNLAAASGLFGFLSGWNLRACLRKALLISDIEAVGGTPMMSNGLKASRSAPTMVFTMRMKKLSFLDSFSSLSGSRTARAVMARNGTLSKTKENTANVILHGQALFGLRGRGPSLSPLSNALSASRYSNMA